MTGCAPRTAFDRRCAEEVSRVRSDGGAVSVLVIDVDRLRPVYEALGREAAEGALRLVAVGIGESCRPGDLVMRWGVDRFVVLAAGTTAAAAGVVGRRIQETVARVLREGSGSLPPLGISIGIADLERAGGTPDELYAAASLALAHAKASSPRGGAVALAPRRGTLENVATAS